MRILLKVAVVAAAAGMVAACGAPSAPPSSTSQASASASAHPGTTSGPTWNPADWDTSKVCGTKRIKIGVEDGLNNTWRKTALEVLRVQIAKCPNIDPHIEYASANGNPQQVSTDINSMVSKGVNLLIVLPDFGDSELPALRAATKAGVTVVPYYGSIGGKAGTDYTLSVHLDTYGIGQRIASWFGKNVPSGNVAVIGDVATSTSAKDLYDGVKAGLAAYPSLKLVGDSFLVGNYDPQTIQKVTTGAIQKYGNITAIATAGCGSMYVAPFTAAGVRPPAVGCSAGANITYCDYSKLSGTAKYPFATWESTTQVIAAALRHGLASYNSIAWDEPTAIVPQQAVDTAGGKAALTCDPGLPADADLTSGLTASQLTAALK
ncbi:Ribose ABC transporter substrate-binding protein [Frankia canadensis]|uniref:Ribose ABC transporter substrate-binding protein n=1 Tax=Frankia canadensis TaxID=1836972 RepID=A0A2I2KSF2_9ACTN|nr:substrate-binding domain-containing protein [Frankia canadensis]SNQ48569.1 Ribose ABC transporter substrate-binding protein [Frankia canadensis]SOU55859.1 Ribose ABC transporter substrate-binding protein [Frankia canadensis]